MELYRDFPIHMYCVVPHQEMFCLYFTYELLFRFFCDLLYFSSGLAGDRIPVRARFSAQVQNGLGAHPVFYTAGTGPLPAVKRAGHGVNHPPYLAPRLKKE